MPVLSPLLLAASLCAPQGEPPADPVERLCEGFTAFDQDGDGRPEIARVRPLYAHGASGPRALVLVEERLARADDAPTDLLPRVRRLVDDLGDGGYRGQALAVDLATADRHQDGRYVLALRELLRAFARDGDLAGAILLGHFPDAFLVRTCNWRKKGDITLRHRQPDQATYRGVSYLRRIPEDVAHRADIVLADLDGRWEDVYVQPRTRLQTTVAVYKDAIPPSGGPCVDLERGAVTFEDFFLVSDGVLETLETVDGEGERTGFALFLDDAAADHECSAEDRARPNALARPDILVSRLDARGTAVQRRDRAWEPDPALERQLLAEYLDRNHAYRTGAAEVVWRPSSLACGLGSGYRQMARAADDWADGDPALADIAGRPTLARAAAWLAYPAVLRTLRAHSDCRGAAFRDGKLDWTFLHDLWKNGTLAPEPAFYVHTGCHAISPPGATHLGYDHPSYGLHQGAEALLLFGHGLALIGRAKVFYDEPRDFAPTLAHATFGAAWAHYFDLESRAPSWSQVGGDIGRKRSYFWSVLGDWSLRMKKRQGG